MFKVIAVVVCLVIWAGPVQHQRADAAEPEFLLIDLEGDGFAFTSASDGVRFAISRGGARVQTAWTKANSGDVGGRPVAQESVPAAVYVLDMAGDGIALTSVADGVLFDIEANGGPVRTGWTTRGSDDAFLCLDVDGNGTIDSAAELVGTRTSLPGGHAVRNAPDAINVLQGLVRGPDGRLPTPLPQGAAFFDREDEAYARVKVWTDRNHDARSQPGELLFLADAGVRAVYGGYRRVGTADAAGNTTILTGSFWMAPRGVDVQRQMWVVSLAR